MVNKAFRTNEKYLFFSNLIFSHEDPACNFSCFAVNHLHLLLQAEAVIEDQWRHEQWGKDANLLDQVANLRTLRAHSYVGLNKHNETCN